MKRSDDRTKKAYAPPALEVMGSLEALVAEVAEGRVLAASPPGRPSAPTYRLH